MEHREAQRAESAPVDDEPRPAGIATIDPDQIVDAVAELARDNPHTTLAGAFVIGCLLGGALTPRLVISLAVMAGRRYAAGMARDAIADFTGGVERSPRT